jgi:hypothetical protein
MLVDCEKKYFPVQLFKVIWNLYFLFKQALIYAQMHFGF